MENDLRSELNGRMVDSFRLHPLLDWQDASGNIVGGIRVEFKTGLLSERSARYLLGLFNREAKKFGYEPVTWKNCIEGNY